MMLLKSKNIIGLVLCTLILSASVPMLFGIQNAPQAVFGGDMVAVSQVNSTTALNVSMLETIKGESNVEFASAEITCFSVVNEYPVLVRGVILEDFMAIEESHIVDGQVSDEERFAVVGAKLADKIGVKVGSRFILTGSSNSAMFQVTVDALYEGPRSDDEILVPLSYARKMAGLGPDSVLFIRVQTGNQSALVETLEEQEAPVVVTDSGGTVTPVNTVISEEERVQQQLAIKYLDTAQFQATNGSYVSMFVREGSNSIRVVIITFIVLDGALAFIGSSAIVSRAVFERRQEIGIISAVGANRSYLRRLILRDVFLISIVASIIGLAMGYGLVWLIEDYGWLQMFGESIHPVITYETAIGIFVASVIIHTLSGLLIGNMLAKVKPRELLQETEKAVREADAPLLDTVLGVEA